MIVSAGVIVLRRLRPEVARPFKAPLFPFIPALGVLLCGYLMFSLPVMTWVRFLLWLGAGLVLYGTYGIKRSRLATG